MDATGKTFSAPYSRTMQTIFDEASNFVLIGLTGRTGSGCSTTANLLASIDLDLPDALSVNHHGNELRKYRIIKNYIEHNWNPFICIKVSDVLARYILELNFAQFCSFVSKVLASDRTSTIDALRNFKNEYDSAHDKVKNYLAMREESKEETNEKKIAAYDIYTSYLPKFSYNLRKALTAISPNAYTKVFQATGDNVRTSGKANSRKFDSNKLFELTKTINKVIKSIRYICLKNKKPCHIVIDAIRNPYEAIFFRERYADFFLISVNTENENRLENLRNSHKFSELQILELDDKEYPKKLEGHTKFVSQDIQKCIEFSDIHINNPGHDQFATNELKAQLFWYVALMLHPGLIMPTATERCMQIAYSAKINSGCISRQVGAVVTDQDFSVKAVGWNNSPQGQVPCVLRNAEDLILGHDKDAFSRYERQDNEFRALLIEKYDSVRKASVLQGRNLSFCFKDVKNELDRDNNQVHTRSLHAEENAFLQISKGGGQQLKGGILFTTASPCELCSKKAYQLGISKVIYIDPYPGIANEHVLAIGEQAPKLELFRGAIGRAYHQLYQPFMPFKDELQFLLNIKKSTNKKEIYMKELEDENRQLREKLELIEAKETT